MLVADLSGTILTFKSLGSEVGIRSPEYLGVNTVANLIPFVLQPSIILREHNNASPSLQKLASPSVITITLALSNVKFASIPFKAPHNGVAPQLVAGNSYCFISYIPALGSESLLLAPVGRV